MRGKIGVGRKARRRRRIMISATGRILKRIPPGPRKAWGILSVGSFLNGWMNGGRIMNRSCTIRNRMPSVHFLADIIMKNGSASPDRATVKTARS